MSHPQTIDRPIKDIIDSITKLVNDGKIKGQLARDLTKLCAVAYINQDKA